MLKDPDKQDRCRVQTQNEGTVHGAHRSLADDKASGDLNQQNRECLSAEHPNQIASKDQEKEDEQAQRIIHTCGADQCGGRDGNRLMCLLLCVLNSCDQLGCV